MLQNIPIMKLFPVVVIKSDFLASIENIYLEIYLLLILEPEVGLHLPICVLQVRCVPNSN